MKQLFRLITLRHIFQEPFRALLLLLGIGLGAAVYVSINIAVGTATEAFRDSINAVAGRAQIQIMGETSSIDEQLFTKIKNLPFVQAAAPVIETVAQIEQKNGEPIMLLGVDIFSEKPFRDYKYLGEEREISDPADFLTNPKAIVISQVTAKRYGLKRGDPLRMTLGSRAVTFRINSVLAAEGPAQALEGSFALVDIAAAQELTEKTGTLDRIDIILKEGTGTEDAMAGLRAVLPSELNVTRPESRGMQVEKMLASYSLNLYAFSLIALLVGVFLIYSSMSFSVARRRRETGILRALGVTQKQVRNLFLFEGCLYGLTGGIVGDALGIFIAKGTLGFVARSITSLYLLVTVEHIRYSWLLLIKACVVSVLVALAAAVRPSREASKVNPREALLAEPLCSYKTSWNSRPTRLSALFLILAVLLSFAGPVYGKPLPGFLAAFMLVLGFALLVPAITIGVTQVLRRLNSRKWSNAVLATSYLREGIAKTAVPMAALVAVLTMLIGLIVMVTSFRGAVDDWLDQYISGDIFVSPSILSTAGNNALLPEEVLKDFRADHEIEDVFAYRHKKFFYDGLPTILTAGNVDVLKKHGRMKFIGGESDPILTKVANGEGVIVTETFAQAHRTGNGGRVTLRTPAGPFSFPVLGIFVDYRTDGGGIWMDRSVFLRYWKEPGVDTVRLYLKDKNRVSEGVVRIKRTYLSKYKLFVLSHADLKRNVLEIFDQTFTITYVLEFIALLVAALGITNTFLVHVFDRQRDIAVYRAIGATRSDVVKAISIESAMMGFISCMIGAVAGTFLSLILVYVINKQAFGWTIRPAFHPSIYFISIIFTVAVSLGASFVPALIASRRQIVRAVRIE